MFDESFYDFKNYFFKVWAVEGARPFFLDENDEPAFLLEWQKDVRVSRYSWDMLDEAERAFVTVLEERWGQPPHLDTEVFNQPLSPPNWAGLLIFLFSSFICSYTVCKLFSDLWPGSLLLCFACRDD